MSVQVWEVWVPMRKYETHMLCPQHSGQDAHMRYDMTFCRQVVAYWFVS
jgi:hypothetical protein